MSTQAQYAVIPRNSSVTIQTANTARDGTGTLGVVATAPGVAGNGRRIDRLTVQAGATTTAGVVRLFITEGRIGAAVSSVTAVGTTVTVTTQTAHGLTTGEKITSQGFFPFNYNVTDTAITVTDATHYTYTVGSTPALLSASTIGNYSSTPATPVTRLLRELIIPAVTPSTTTAAYSTSLSSASSNDIGLMPIALEAGYSLRASTHNAEVFYVTATFGGDLA